MSSNARFAITIACFMGLAFIFGALFQAQYIAKCRTNLSSFTARETRQEGYVTKAGVSLADSIAFELAASEAHNIDMPEELPSKGDTMCAYVARDTVFVEYWHNQPSQRNNFRYIHGN